MTEVSTKNSDFTINDFVNVFNKHKKFLCIVSIISLLISIVIAFFVMHPYFYSSAMVKSSDKSGGLGALLGSSSIPELGGLEEFGLGSGSKDLQLYEQILLSHRCIEETFVKFNLYEDYDYTYKEDAYKYFKTEILVISKNVQAGTMEIGVYDKNPQKAKEIVEFLVSKLDKINVELNVLNAKNNREFIEQRYNIVKNDLKKAEDSLKIYQDVNGIAPDLQAKFAAQSNLQLETEIKAEEVKLDLLSKIVSPDQPELVQQKAKVDLLKSELTNQKNSSFEESNLNLKNLPQVTLNFFRLQREVEVQNKILTFLLPLYEQAKIQEKKDTPTIMLIDKPYVADKKAKPKRLVVVLLIVGSAFLFSYLILFIKEVLFAKTATDSI